jgi:hypothetical protein
MPIIRSSRLYLCYYRIWCVMPWLLVVGGQVQGSRLWVQDEGSCSSSFPHPGRIACSKNTNIVSSSWWWTYKCLKHVEQIISALNHLVASSWFSSLHTCNDARTNIHQILALIIKPPPTSSLCTKEELTYCTHTSLPVGSFSQLPSSGSQPSNCKHFLQSDGVFRIQAFFHVAPCDLVNNYWHFRGLLSLHHYKQGVKDPEALHSFKILVTTHH